MWTRLEGVAGNIRTNVSQLAKDVLEGGEDDSPQQVCGEISLACTIPGLNCNKVLPLIVSAHLQGNAHGMISNGFQQYNALPHNSSHGQQSLHAQPYPQAAGVYAAQQAAPHPMQARPSAHWQAPLQQIPFMPHRPASSQQGIKPKLFVPQQAPRPSIALPAEGGSTAVPSLSGTNTKTNNTVALNTQPAVSSRLSALKAKLDQDKHRAADDSKPNVKYAPSHSLVQSL